jgi:perosamine synthetase
VRLPVERPDRRHSWHLYAIQVEPDGFADGRAGFIAGLTRHGVGASVHWMPLHLHPYYRQTYGYGEGLFPVAEAAWPRLVSLPIYPDMTDAEIDHVVGVVRRLVEERGQG